MKGLWGDAIGMSCERVKFDVIGTQGICRVEHALSVRDLELPSQSLSLEIAERIKNVENVPIKSYVNARTMILLGQDNWELIMPIESRPIKNSGLVISRSKLGWAAHGYIENKKHQFIGLNVETSSNELSAALHENAEKLKE